jgi:hypothetical protein
MPWWEVMHWIKSAITKPEWWSAAAGILGVFVALLAFYAAWRAARAAGAAYQTQLSQLDEMKSQTASMFDQVSEIRQERLAAKFEGLSIWLAEESDGLSAKIHYVNTTGHPVYNIYLEITDISERFVSISALEPTSAPKSIEKANEFFQNELRLIGDLRRPGICYQFDTSSGQRYIRDHIGSLISVGGNPAYTLPHKKWLPEWRRS